MNRFSLITILVLFAILFCTTCKKEDNQPIKEENEEDNHPVKIEGLTLKNFPFIDGSTSTDPLVRIIAGELLGYDYHWLPSLDHSWYIQTDLPKGFVEQHLKSSQTHYAFINLINKSADLILSARAMATVTIIKVVRRKVQAGRVALNE